MPKEFEQLFMAPSLRLHLAWHTAHQVHRCTGCTPEATAFHSKTSGNALAAQQPHEIQRSVDSVPPESQPTWSSNAACVLQPRIGLLWMPSKSNAKEHQTPCRDGIVAEVHLLHSSSLVRHKVRQKLSSIIVKAILR
mmetsp:Transcript_39905/g.113981  ORF Transcript_39905/g.113981 Transcript_39905/m.113981 type:complete len:137 (+) Transcript_39905:372-782(+)